MMTSITPPAFSDLSDYYQSYQKYLTENDLLSALKDQTNKSHEFLSGISSEMENFRYAEGKWMIKEVAGHLCDTERILTYRALRFSRNDKTELSSFDENSYVENSNFRNRTLNDISRERKHVRLATLDLFSTMTEQQLDNWGKANNVRVSPRNILYFILVHERHHIQVINDKYLKAFAVHK
jgi:uncharacterized damage-inducible protein DinB